jgi:hypothetical protein
MASQLPTDILLHIGDFLLHRDARCMQATCINWKTVWTAAALRVPHPSLQHIEVCNAIHCFNRRHVIDQIEPMLVFGTQTETELQRILQFMSLLPLSEVLVWISRFCRQPRFELRATSMKRSLAFWCTCQHRNSLVPEVCTVTWTVPTIVDTPDFYFSTGHIIVWCSLWCMVGVFLIPIMMTSTALFMVLAFVYTVSKEMYQS